MCFLPIHSGHQACWTYQPGSHRRKATQHFSSTFLLRCLPYFFSREGFSHSFSSSTVKSNSVYERINLSPLVRHFYFFILYFLVRKIPVTGIRTHVPTYQNVSRLPTELPGRPACEVFFVFIFERVVSANGSPVGNTLCWAGRLIQARRWTKYQHQDLPRRDDGITRGKMYGTNWDHVGNSSGEAYWLV